LSTFIELLRSLKYKSAIIIPQNIEDSPVLIDGVFYEKVMGFVD